MLNESFNSSNVEKETKVFPKNNTTNAVESLKDNDVTFEENETNKEDKYSTTIANMSQWAAKLKEDIKTEASSMTYEVSEKTVAKILTKLLKSMDSELKGFDQKVEDAKSLVANAEEERQKIAAKKEKYQGMIDQLET